MVGKFYEVKYDEKYDGNSKARSGVIKTIKAIMVNDYPSRYVFADEDGTYIIPHQAIYMMQPIINKETQEKRDVLNDFLNGRICVNCEGAEKVEFLKFLNITDIRWCGGVLPTQCPQELNSLDAYVAYLAISKRTNNLLWDTNSTAFTRDDYELMSFHAFMCYVRSQSN